MVLSFAAHAVLILGLLLVPLFVRDTVDLHPVNAIDIVTAPLAVQPVVPFSAAVRPSLNKRNNDSQSAPILVTSRPVGSPTESRATTSLELDTAPSILGAIPSNAPEALGGIMGSGSRANFVASPADNVASAMAASSSTAPLRVGGRIREPRLLSQVTPAYPPIVRKARIQGDVVLEAVINTEGDVVEVHAISGNEFLFRSAIDAVSQWKYAPTILDGQVFPVRLRITVSFRLKNG
jgi:protein TonB